MCNLMKKYEISINKFTIKKKTHNTQRKWHQHNGRLGSSKLVFPNENIKLNLKRKEKRKQAELSEPIVSVLWKQSQVYSNRASAQSRKRHLQSRGKVLWHSSSPSPHLLPGTVAVAVWKQQPPSQSPPLNWRGQSRLFASGCIRAIHPPCSMFLSSCLLLDYSSISLPLVWNLYFSIL